MRPLLRLTQRLAPSQPCTRQRCLHTSIAHGQIPFTERVRRQLWGTDKPPGAADPYKPRDPNDPYPEEETYVEEDATEITKADGGVAGGVGVDPEEYQPNTDARAMMIVGTRGAFMKREWDPLHIVEKYEPPQPLTSISQITAFTRRAVIEVYTQLLSQRSIPTISSEGVEMKKSKFKLQVDEATREYIFLYSSPNVMHQAAKGQHAGSLYRGASDAWKKLPLGDVDMKFAITKRILDLTGRRIPDPVLSYCHTVSDLLVHLTARTKPPQPVFVQEVATAVKKKKLRNVVISRRQIKPTDREKAIGRTATIELITATAKRLPGETPYQAYLRKRRERGVGVGGIETYEGVNRRYEHPPRVMGRIKKREVGS